MSNQSTAQPKNNPQCCRQELANVVREFQAVQEVLALLLNRKHLCENCSYSGSEDFEELVTGGPAGIPGAGEDENDRQEVECNCSRSGVKLIPELASEMSKKEDIETLKGKQQVRSYAEVARALVTVAEEEIGSVSADGTSSGSLLLEPEIKGRMGQPWRVRIRRKM